MSTMSSRTKLGNLLVSLLSETDYLEAGQYVAAIEFEAIINHEATLRERGWLDEYESEATCATCCGDGAQSEADRILAAVKELPKWDKCAVPGGFHVNLSAVLRIIEGGQL